MTASYAAWKELVDRLPNDPSTEYWSSVVPAIVFTMTILHRNMTCEDNALPAINDSGPSFSMMVTHNHNTQVVEAIVIQGIDSLLEFLKQRLAHIEGLGEVTVTDTNRSWVNSVMRELVAVCLLKPEVEEYISRLDNVRPCTGEPRMVALFPEDFSAFLSCLRPSY